jgi:hypothetical protein
MGANMTEAKRLREEAERCLRLARLISNPQDVETLTAMANSYLQRAKLFESQSGQPVPPPRFPQQDAHAGQQQQQPQEPQEPAHKKDE